MAPTGPQAGASTPPLGGAPVRSKPDAGQQAQAQRRRREAGGILPIGIKQIVGRQPDRQRFRRLPARIGGQLDIAVQTVLFASVSAEQRRYDGQEPLFLTQRADEQSDLRAGVNYSFTQGWTLSPQISYTDNKSNIATSKFTRSMASVLLRRDF